MPGTTRYSATFDRPYEEDEADLPADPPAARRSRSQSWQATTIGNGRPYTPLGGAYRPHPRSSSTDNGAPKGAELIPTRTVGKAAVKAHSNPFQFVKVGTCPLYKKAEEQLKTVKEVKKPEVLKEEEEEWQTNLDSWKSRRRKMSETAFRRLDEMKQLEMEEKTFSTQQKKIKTFSEMVEERAHRGRTLSLCLFSNPLDLDEWKFDTNKDATDDDTNSNDNQLLSGESEESSVINSEDDNDTYLKQEQSNADRNGNKSIQNGVKMRRTGAPNALQKQNGFHKDVLKSNGDFKLAELDIGQESITQKEDHGLSGMYIDSGLESLSSSHRAGDIPDSGSDFSQDSGSSMDCDSPRVTRLITTGVELLEEFSSKDDELNNEEVFHNEKLSGMELSLRLCFTGANTRQYGFTVAGGKDKGAPITVASVVKGSVSDAAGVKCDDHILSVNNDDVASLTHSAVIFLLKKAVDAKQMNLVLRRPLPTDCMKKTSNSSVPVAASRNKTSRKSDDSKKCSSQAFNHELVTTENNRDSVIEKQVPKKSNVPCKSDSAESKQLKKDVCSVQKERSIESENEMYVDDFDELELIEKTSSVNDAVGNSASSAVDTNQPSNNVSKPNCVLDYNNKVPVSSPIAKDSTLNVIYQSHCNGSLPTTQNISKNTKDTDVYNGKSILTSKTNSKATTPVNEVPVEKVAEEMERLILEQLEQEERAKEMTAEMESSGNFEFDENQAQKQMITDIEVPPRLLEPPKEKPPPPPSSNNSSQKQCSLKRVNSTKRIKKEIHKRRSDFLGIDTDEENAICDESSIPSPPALEDILKAEREIDRVRRQMLVGSSQNSVEDEEIARKEREIIANLETEERRKLNLDASNSSETEIEEERINRLKEERKRIEEERLIKEEQKIRLDEERQLCEREAYLRKQEFEPKPIIPNNDESIVCISSVSVNGKTNLSHSVLSNVNSKMNGFVSNDCSIPNSSQCPNEKGTLKKVPVYTPSKLALNCSNARSKISSNINTKPELNNNSLSDGVEKSSLHFLSAELKIDNREELQDTEETTAKEKVESGLCVRVSGINVTKKENTLPNYSRKCEKEVLGNENIPNRNTCHENGAPDKNVKDSSKTHNSEDFIKDNAKFKINDQCSSNADAICNEPGMMEHESNLKTFSKKMGKGKNRCEISLHQLDSDKNINKNLNNSDLVSKNIAIKMNCKQTTSVNEAVSKLSVSSNNSTSVKKKNITEAIASDESDSNQNDAEAMKEMCTESVDSKVAKTKKVNKQNGAGAITSDLSKGEKNYVEIRKRSCLEVAVNNVEDTDEKFNTKVKPKIHPVVTNDVLGKKNVATIMKQNSTEIIMKDGATKKESTVKQKNNVEKGKNDVVMINTKDSGEIAKRSYASAVSNVVSPLVAKSDPEDRKESSAIAVSSSVSENIEARNNSEIKKENRTAVMGNDAIVDSRNNCVANKKNSSEVCVNIVIESGDVKPVLQGSSTGTVARELESAKNSKVLVKVITEDTTKNNPAVISKDKNTTERNQKAVHPSKENVANCEKLSGPNLVRVRKKVKKEIKPADSCASDSVSSPVDTNIGGSVNLSSEQSNIEISSKIHANFDQVNDIKDKTCDKIEKDDSSIEPTPVLSPSATPITNIAKPTPDSSLSSSATNNMFLQNGDGKNTIKSDMITTAEEKIGKTEEIIPPPVAKKPLKKKEIIRKERERLRQEQEVLMREREEHRRKVQMEQEQLKNNVQKAHVSDVPLSRVGPPPPAKPALPSQLTSPSHAPQGLREDMYASRSLQSSGQNNVTGSHSHVVQQSQRQSASRQNRAAPQRSKALHTETWTQNTVPMVKKQADSSSESRYNQNHWLIQEAEMRRITEHKERQRGQIATDSRYPPSTQMPYHQSSHVEEASDSHTAVQRTAVMPVAQPLMGKSNYSAITPMHSTEQPWNCGQPVHPNVQNRKHPVSNMSGDISQSVAAYSRNFADPSLQPPSKPSRIVPVEKQEQMLSVSGRKKCSHCGEELGRGAAMIIESLQLYYHIHCFRCCVCQAQLGNGSCGTDVRVRNNKLHCHNCYSNDEAGLKFSQV